MGADRERRGYSTDTLAEFQVIMNQSERGEWGKSADGVVWTITESTPR